MKNFAMPLAIALVGLGLMSIGFNLNGNQANATTAAPVAFNQGPDLPTIVWYQSFPVTVAAGAGAGAGSGGGSCCRNTHQVYHEGPGFMLVRAWSTGEVEARYVNRMWNCDLDVPCTSPWKVIAEANEGIRAIADINFDSRVNAEDLGIMLAAWGDAPRNDYPPSDCPLGLIP